MLQKRKQFEAKLDMHKLVFVVDALVEQQVFLRASAFELVYHLLVWNSSSSRLFCMQRVER